MYTYVVIRKLLYYMQFGTVSATPYCNFSLQCILLLDIFCSTLWNLAEYKILFLVAIICSILTIRYYINYDFHKVLLIKLSILEYNYGYCKKELLTISATTWSGILSTRYYFQN